MRYFKLIILLLLIICLSAVKAQDIKWQEDRPLKWEDFQGPPDYKFGSVAVTSWNTAYSYKVDFRDSNYVITFEIRNYFQTQKSWRKRGD